MVGSGDPPPKLFQEISLHSDAPDGFTRSVWFPVGCLRSFEIRCAGVLSTPKV